MKSIAGFAIIPLLVEARVISNKPNVLRSRQLDSIFGMIQTMFRAPKAPLSTTKLDPEYDPKATREVKLWGPFTLNPSNGTHQAGPVKLDPNSDVLVSMISGICKDCTVLAGHARMVYKNGTQTGISNGVYGHHFITVDLGRPQVLPPAIPTCANRFAGLNLGGTSPRGGVLSGIQGKNSHGSHQKRQMPGISVFVAKGGDDGKSIFTAVNSTIKSGFYIGKQDSILFTAELVNYDPIPKEVYFSLDYEYVPGRPQGLLDVGMGTLDVTGCGNFTISPPADKPVTFKSTKWKVIQNGYLINITPHLHDGGLNIKVYLNDRLVCTSEAVYGGAQGGTTIGGQKWETISSYKSCLAPVPLKVGDVLTMTSDYDLTKHRLRPFSMNREMGAESMAMANFQFARAV